MPVFLCPRQLYAFHLYSIFILSASLLIPNLWQPQYPFVEPVEEVV